MASNMDVDMASSEYQAVQIDGPQVQPTTSTNIPPVTLSNSMQHRDSFKEIPVKVHIRKPERDTWVYVGRGIVSLEVTGHSSQVVVRSTSTNKVLTTFSEESDLQAEKRGNFVVVGCVDGPKVVSWSLNALNNAETLRLLASIELACYRCKQAVGDPRLHHKSRRRVERAIKDDRRKRHKRRQEQDSMVDLFSKQNLNELPSVPAES
ncbi:hypothetical protein FA95DRAFT_1674346 [Auriscalpium vulgare]|uniref:Uncharacterized protein n=1 Tax=Auriscalpium vulgare TaxID=40419 RepID=A0ACB8S9Y7_9AGAM|nr:hypothetical protein FA95DRAFT_1674346 [Auriscalpium vulgare]